MRRRGLRFVLLAAVFVSLGVVSYKTARNLWLSQARKIRSSALDYLPQGAFQVKDFRRTHVQDGRTAWEVTGEEARYLKGAREATIKNPRFVLYDKEGSAIEATGLEARLFLGDTEREVEKVELRSQVRVSYQGFLLETGEAFYLRAQERVVLPGRVKVKGEGLEAEGVGMEIALAEEKLRFLKEVRTRLVPGALKGAVSYVRKNRP